MVEMLRKLCRLLQIGRRNNPDKDRFDLLSRILSIPQNRENFLGVSKTYFPSKEDVLKDVHHVLSYSKTEDYRVWAQEAWTYILGCIDKLSDPETHDNIDFYRGRLSMAIQLLGISYKARAVEEERKNGSISSTPRTL